MYAWAQAGETEPALQQRAAETDDALGPEWAGLQRGHTSLPAGAWGEYALGAPGEVVELDMQDRRLTGYMSRLGDQESDKQTVLTYFFDRSTISGTRATFRTRAIHGIWYSFAGEIAPGGDAGGYVLAGTLTEHARAQGTEQPRRVGLRKIPVYGGR